MLRVRCKVCNTEINSNSKAQCCGCTNQMIVHNEVVTARNLSEVVLINTDTNVREAGHLTQDQLQWQEARRHRKIRKLTYEER